MKSNAVTLGLLIVGAAIAAEYVWHGRQVADLRREIASLREGQTDTRAPPPVAPYAVPRAARPWPAEIAEADPRAPAPPPHEDRAQGSEEEKRARWKEDEIAHRTAVEAGFAAETVDREWAPDARRDLSNQVAALLPQASSVRDVDCRSSMCRVELVVASAAVSDQFMRQAFLGPERTVWRGGAFMEPAQPNPDGSMGVVLYLAREGAGFPE
jgi:hypothetical protein